VQASPNPARSKGTGLSGISCPSAATCVAAGSYLVVVPIESVSGTMKPTQTLAEIWRDTRWHIQASANRNGATVDDGLSAVSCTSPTTCTAVGFYANPAGTPDFLADAERRNGTSWNAEPSPRVPGFFFDPELHDVSCTSPRACTAVGSDTKPALDSFALAEHWNGARWAVQPSSRFAGGRNAQLSGVSCRTAHACTAVGANGKSVPLAERWDGARWSVQPSPRPAGTGSELIGVSCASAHACTAVGEYSTNDRRERTLAEHWNGTRWTIQPTPNPARTPFAELDDVSCSSADRCTAIGLSELSNRSRRTLAERWNGTRWIIQPTPNRAAGADLTSVSCPSAHACTAVGRSHLANGATWMLIESWNGTRWALEPTPALNAYDSGLAWVWCTTPRDCTAVGFYFGLTGFSLNLAITTPARATPAR
jgi:hypothetical protein